MNEEASAAEASDAGGSDDEFLPEEENEREDADFVSEILKSNKRKKHPSELPGRHPCPSCDKVYRCRKSLSTHYRIHHDPNPGEIIHYILIFNRISKLSQSNSNNLCI